MTTKYVRLRPGQKRRKGYQWRVLLDSRGTWTKWTNGALKGAIPPWFDIQYRAPRLRKGKK